MTAMILIFTGHHFVALCSSQGHETSALLILEKISDRNLINCTNAALQTYVVFPWDVARFSAVY